MIIHRRRLLAIFRHLFSRDLLNSLNSTSIYGRRCQTPLWRSFTGVRCPVSGVYTVSGKKVRCHTILTQWFKESAFWRNTETNGFTYTVILKAAWRCNRDIQICAWQIFSWLVVTPTFGRTSTVVTRGHTFKEVVRDTTVVSRSSRYSGHDRRAWELWELRTRPSCMTHTTVSFTCPQKT